METAVVEFLENSLSSEASAEPLFSSEETYPDSEESSFWGFGRDSQYEEDLPHNLWGFSPHIWSEIQRKYSVETLYEAIRDCYAEIKSGIEIFRPYIETAKKTDSLYQKLEGLSSLGAETGTYRLDPARVHPIQDGISGSYFIADREGQLVFVVKPIDEDGGCLNNPKGLATPYITEDFLREDVPLYRSSLREALTSEIAREIGVEKIAPKTVLALLESDAFSFQIDGIVEKEKERYLQRCGAIPREKLCSVQEFVPHAKTLFEARFDLQLAGLTNEEIANRFDQRSFEEANLLIWITGDTDAHAGNILVYPQGCDALGNEILGIKKIDNGLAYPEENGHFYNSLASLPNGYRPLSDEIKAKIGAIDETALAAHFHKLHMEASLPAMRERLALLKEVALREGITARQITKAMAFEETSL